MKQKVFIFAVLVMALAMPKSLMAHDFSAVAPTGQTLYYSFNYAGNAVYVVYPGSGWNGSVMPTGALTIPSTVTYNSTTYTVTGIGNSAFSGCSGLTSVIIPNTVTSIGDNAFYYCDITSVTIPSSVTSIGDDAFYYCSGLTSISLPNSVTSIGYQAFGYCTGLTSIFIPNSVTNIGSYAFYYCSGLTTVSIGRSVTSIGTGAFYQCTNLTRVNYYGTVAQWCSIDFSSADANPVYWAEHLYIGGSELTNLVIPDSVTSICNNAFVYCRGLNSVTIGSGVTSIGMNAFAECTGVRNIVIPNTVLSIGGSAFGDIKHIEYHGTATGEPWGAISMNGYTQGDFVFSNSARTNLIAYIGNGSEVVIPSTVDTIGKYAFYSCMNLTTVTLPNGLSRIGNCAFYDCSSLSSINIPNSVNYIGEWAFRGTTNLTSITLPNALDTIRTATFVRSGINSVNIPSSVVYIGDRAFGWCQNLSSVVISDNVNYIDLHAFNYDSNLVSLTIGSGVMEINDEAFLDCVRLTKINSLAPAAPALGSGVFSGVARNIEVDVPCGSLMSYYARWTWFNNFVEEEGFHITATSADETMGHAVVVIAPTCSSPISLVDAVAEQGYKFDHWSDGNTDNPRVFTLTGDSVIMAYFGLPTGIDDIPSVEANVYANQGQIVVESGNGDMLPEVMVYDVMGRSMAHSGTVYGSNATFSVPATGVYMVKVGTMPARRVVVVK